MAETWWKWGQATYYLLGQYPCDSPIDARELLESKIEDSTLSVRYRTRGGEVCVPIERQEWRRSGDRNFLEWERLEEQSRRDFELGFGVGEFEVEAAAVQRLCTPQGTQASKRGRPPKNFVAQLAGYGGAWLAVEGLPDTHVVLADALRDECETRGWEYGDTQIRELAAELIRSYRAVLDRDL